MKRRREPVEPPTVPERLRAAWPTAVGLGLLLALAGCNSAVIEGQVVDTFGNPIPGARVTVVGSMFAAESDQQGLFKLEYAPGKFEVEAAAEQHISATRSVEMSQKTQYPMAPLELVPVPQPGGIKIATSDGYTALAEQPVRFVKRRVGSYGLTPMYCRDALAPRDLATLQHETFTVFAVADPEKPPTLLAVGEGGVLSSEPLNMFAHDCVGQQPKQVELDWTRVGEQVYSTVVLQPGNYCLGRLRGTFLDGKSVSQTAYCFRWGAAGTASISREDALLSPLLREGGAK